MKNLTHLHLSNWTVNEGEMDTTVSIILKTHIDYFLYNYLLVRKFKCRTNCCKQYKNLTNIVENDKKWTLTLQNFILNILEWVVNIFIQFSSNRPQSYYLTHFYNLSSSKRPQTHHTYIHPPNTHMHTFTKHIHTYIH